MFWGMLYGRKPKFQQQQKKKASQKWFLNKQSY